MDSKMYINRLPYEVRKELCSILDENNEWLKLARLMKYDEKTIENLKSHQKDSSPSDQLLQLWQRGNHEVRELFILLNRMKHYHAMLGIKDYVQPEYHAFIKIENPNELKRKLDHQRVDPNIPPQNFNCGEKILNVQKVLPVSRENNVSVTDNYQNGSSDISESAGETPQIPFKDLQESTNNWATENFLGKGGFGTVYKGYWIHTQVAIKRLHQKQDKPDSLMEQLRESKIELHCLNSYRHDNILPLYGYSIDGPDPCLIYQYMSGGSLDSRLRVKDPSRALSWSARLDIAIGVARGLQFLHAKVNKRKEPLIHGDIKPGNILLDLNDQPKIGDFGLARKGPDNERTHITLTSVSGTKAYLPQEFLSGGHFSIKVDSFSFGIVAFELATSLPACSKELRSLRDYVLEWKGDLRDLMCKQAGGEGYFEYFKGLIDVGTKCVSKLPKNRPDMVEALIALQAVRDGKK